MMIHLDGLTFEVDVLTMLDGSLQEFRLYCLTLRIPLQLGMEHLDFLMDKWS